MARRVALLVTLLAVAGAAACGDGGSDAGEPDAAAATTTTTTTTLGTGDGSFEVRSETFVDESRATGDQPGRTLATDIYVPGGEGPFPVVVHAHGSDGSSAKFSELLSSWASAGYLVVAPNFPRTNDGAPAEVRDPADYVNQPGDLAFVVDQVLAEGEPGGRLEGLVAEEHLGVSGMSLGGATVYGALFHPCCADDRYDAAIVMSAPELPFEGGTFDRGGELPILAMAGTLDFSVPYDAQQDVIDRLPGPTWSVTLENGLHAHPFENSPSPHDDLVESVTTDFWALTLRDDEAAADRLVADATVEGLSSVEVRP